MLRREFITGIGATAVLPLAARAQQRIQPIIGYLVGEMVGDSVIPFRQGLKDSGYIEGQNVAIEYRSADGHYDRVPALVADLVQRQVTVIVANDVVAALAAKKATATIPIVFSRRRPRRAWNCRQLE